MYECSIGIGHHIPVSNQSWHTDDSSVESHKWLPGELNNIMVANTTHILQTPLFEYVHNDRRIWKPESNGRYSVRSGYPISLQQ